MEGREEVWGGARPSLSLSRICLRAEDRLQQPCPSQPLDGATTGTRVPSVTTPTWPFPLGRSPAYSPPLIREPRAAFRPDTCTQETPRMAG